MVERRRSTLFAWEEGWDDYSANLLKCHWDSKEVWTQWTSVALGVPHESQYVSPDCCFLSLGRSERALLRPLPV